MKFFSIAIAAIFAIGVTAGPANSGFEKRCLAEGTTCASGTACCSGACSSTGSTPGTCMP
ncbi:hypothetical protein N7478_001161 [Penicillium angulare]|uniref:uncharacterized protein n=1 Tax=Penicillium angulare TaxID=116970 RepID=UPI00254198AA|nr:uncharacterized protein N7478_001161 [Penicillium angulare]KAJ5291910.1 hypothetical protein N7478_001161 [Penicillium angulare]